VTRIYTPAQTGGPLFGHYILSEALKRSVREDDTRPLCIEGQIYDGDGKPVAREMFVEIWAEAQFVRAATGPGGFYRIWISRPAPGRLPDGQTLAPCFYFCAAGRGVARQIETRIYLPGDPANLTDPVLALAGDAAERLVAVSQPGSDALRFDVHLQGPRETPFFRY